MKDVSAMEDDAGVERERERAGAQAGAVVLSMPPFGEGAAEDGELRARQEREVAVRHSVAAMEFALAREAACIGHLLARAGLAFDPLTFIATRILEASEAEQADPVDTLGFFVEDGSLARSVELAAEQLDTLGEAA
jgi:hypothetical protein